MNILVLDQRGIVNNLISAEPNAFNSYKFQFCTDLDSTTRALGQATFDALIIVANEVAVDLRLLIRNASRQLGDLLISIFSAKEMALDAWKLNLFHFELYPPEHNSLIKTLAKTKSSKTSQSQNLIFKTKEGLFKLMIQDLLFIKASGNYSEFHIKGDKKLVQTRQLNKYSGLVATHPDLERIHRSFIINLANIQKINGPYVKFFKSTAPLEVSTKLASKLKKHLLGYA